MADAGNICKQPVVAIVGHIDHGKTTLLDYIRKSAVAAKETGGITQKVSAYEVEHTGAEGIRLLTFIDTPGHEAFQKMRERAGTAADIAILIVAADDGVKPQTLSAYKAIQAANIPFVVAFTKVDKDTANLEKAKESVMREGIYLEGLGGEVPFAAVSGKTGAGVPELLDLIVLAGDLHAVQCDSEAPLEAIVIESMRDAKVGNTATVIIKKGTLESGGFAVAGETYAPLRVIEDANGKKVSKLLCGKPARISGFSQVPKVGTVVNAVGTKKEAEARAEEHMLKSRDMRKVLESDGEKLLIRIVLKADTAGSVEALEHEIAKLSYDALEMHVVSKGTGNITENDVKPLIGFSPSFVIGFNVKAEPNAEDLANRQSIVVETRGIIYELADWFKETLDALALKEKKVLPGAAEILKYFSTSGSKHVIGGRVTESALSVGDRIMIYRRGIEVAPGKITNLQQGKADTASVSEGTEFGAQIETKGDIIAGDTIIASHVKKQ